MRLPPDNAVELPADDMLVVDAGEPVALSDADVLALLPAWVRRANTSLRDAVVRATRRFWSRVQARVGFVLNALQTPRNAWGARLDAHGAKRQQPRVGALEGDAAYRARMLTRPQRITPTAIREAVTSLVTAESPVAPVLFEPATDGVFVQGEADALLDGAWCCFYQPVAGPPLWAENFPLATAGVWVSAEATLRRPLFVVLMEGSLYDLPSTFFAMTEGYDADVSEGDFVGSDSPLVSWGFVASEAPPLEDRVVREVERRRGGGVIWWLYVLPDLGGAL